MKHRYFNIGDIILNEKVNFTILHKEYRIKNVENNKKETWYKYKCNNCGYVGWKSIGRIDNVNCPCCSSRPKVVVEGINDIPTTAPWMVKYFQGGYDEAKLYTKCSAKKIYPKCPDCGEVRKTSTAIYNLNKLKGFKCANCNDGASYPEKLMKNLLDQLDVDYEMEKSFKWCTFKKYNSNKLHKGFYDFFINNHNLIIEMDGGWHGKDNNLSKMTSEESNYIDNMKDKLALDQGYKVIRIESKYSNMEHIKSNILTSELTSYLDLTLIDWDICEKYAISNMCKEICLYRNDTNESTFNIAKKFHLNQKTIPKYLKIGNKFGWCIYDAKEEQRKNGSRNGKKNHQPTNEIPVSIYKNGIFIERYKSIKELERKSFNDLGIKILAIYVYRYFYGKQNTVKGYTFSK